MDWNWFLFSFEGRINRARCWFAAFMWLATNFAFMMILLFVVSGILRVSGSESSVVSTRTMHPAFYLLGFPLFAINLWMVAATATKRLHDRDKSGWWLVPFFVAPPLLDRLWDWLDNPTLAPLVSAISFGLSVWCFVELFWLRGTKGTNRFGPDPLAVLSTGARWKQHDELEFTPHSAGPSPASHVKRGHD